MLTGAEIAHFGDLRAQALAGQVGFWEIYDELRLLLISKGVPATDSTVVWLAGATQANKESGAFFKGAEIVFFLRRTERNGHDDVRWGP